MRLLHSQDGVELGVVAPDSGGFPRHSHDDYVISVNVNGRERVRLDTATFEVGTDEVTLYNPGQVQSCTTTTREGAPWACASLYVAPHAVASLTGGRLVAFERPVVHAPGLRSEMLGLAGALTAARERTGRDPDLAMPARTASAAPRPGTGGSPGQRPGSPVWGDRRAVPDAVMAADRWAVHERLAVMLLALLDLAGQRRPTTAPRPDDPRIAAVYDRLRSDLSAAVRLADLAADVDLSREQLIRSFTRATGSPPYAWHLQARLAEGWRLLRQGRPIAEVAHGLGFADQAHFAKHFRAAYATTPGRYRTAATRQQDGVPSAPRAAPQRGA